MSRRVVRHDRGTRFGKRLFWGLLHQLSLALPVIALVVIAVIAVTALMAEKDIGELLIGKRSSWRDVWIDGGGAWRRSEEVNTAAKSGGTSFDFPFPLFLAHSYRTRSNTNCSLSNTRWYIIEKIVLYG